MDLDGRTELGTPLSPKWDAEWVAAVEGVEKGLGRRVCGAHSPAWTPCKLGSEHPSGRCRYHGGHSSIGAPLGNRNAMIHGLYSRRLQQCGEHCPLWQTCPMPNKDIEALPHKERPFCPYEKEEYDAVTSSLGTGNVAEGAVACGDALAEAETTDSRDCRVATLLAKTEGDAVSPDAEGATISFGSTFSFSKEKVEEKAVGQEAAETLLHHNIATFQVMLTRAQAALGWSTFTEESRADGEKYSMRSSKVSAMLQAQLRIARELRQWLRLLATDAVRLALNIPASSPPSNGDQGGCEHLGLADLVQPLLEKSEGVLEDTLEFQRRVDAGEIDADHIDVDLDLGSEPPLPAPA